LTRIAEIDVLHLEKLLRGCLDTFQTTRMRELKLELIRCRQLEIVLGLRLQLDKIGHAALVVDQFAVGPPDITLLVMNHICTNLLKKVGVVRNTKDCLMIQSQQVVCNPLDSRFRQVIRWLVL